MTVSVSLNGEIFEQVAYSPESGLEQLVEKHQWMQKIQEENSVNLC